jgi:flavin prenyltransferase
MKKKRLIIGISGASGLFYGQRLLEFLRPTEIETHLIVSKNAQLVRVKETNYPKGFLESLADVCYFPEDFSASISSGSYITMGMIIAPCSVRSLSEIASGVTTTLLTRSADVVLKEHRKLVLLLRETPLHLGHLESMVKVAKMGGIIAPPVPAFYHHPQTIEDIIDQTVGRALDLFDIETDLAVRWGENLSCSKK